MRILIINRFHTVAKTTTENLQKVEKKTYATSKFEGKVVKECKVNRDLWNLETHWSGVRLEIVTTKEKRVRLRMSPSVVDDSQTIYTC